MTSYINALTRAFGSDHGTLSVVLNDKEGVARAGCELGGTVVLQVDQESTGGKIEVELVGKEKAIRKKGPMDLCKDHVFFTATVPVSDLSRSRLNPGEMRLPFSVNLPGSLPSSSMHRLGVGDAGFNIQYKLTARMGSCHKSIPVAIAAAPLEHQRAPFVMQPVTQPVISVKGKNLGSICVAASVQNIHIRKGEQLRLSLSCRNDSLVKIQRVEVKMVELLNWGLKEGYSKTKVNKTTLANIDDLKLPGLERENANKSNIVEVNHPTMEEQIAKYTSMHDNLASGTSSVELECPIRAKDSYAGVLVDIRHYLKAKFITDTYGVQPSIKIPLKIGLPDEIPRSSIRLTSAAASTKIASVALAELPKERSPGCNNNELPLASAVPIPSSPGAKDFAVERAVEPAPSLRPKKVNFHQAVTGQDCFEIETNLQDLIPMVPST
ncbi:Arrestin domain containing [Seminavis robusta]|uniref:Arrestin domain containing n=1 Tax=Seminavis robusta TaxID=568900 RepID=A0A9N8D705_9STRA|nr:Arrestin domain containing [Seminavis robusta]|eukprot:Sro22_g015130.1 Arrestin domain containing (438) ;mRNA; f:17912-19385